MTYRSLGTRREFIKGSLMAGTAMAVLTARGSGKSPDVREVRGVRMRDETILRLGGVGDDYWITWGADDRQYLAVEDGFGWSKNVTTMYNGSRWAVEGEPHNARFSRMETYPSYPMPPSTNPYYYPYGNLAAKGRMYQFLTTLNQVPAPGESWFYSGAKLIYSSDQGQTWFNQNGTTPVTWESWEAQSRSSLMFFHEPQEAFSLLSFLQMGRDYGDNRDGYVYVYSPNGHVDGQMNELVLARVPIQDVCRREQYEFFVGCDSAGNASWSRDIEARGAVYTFPRGWVDAGTLPGQYVMENWVPSVAYNKALRQYLMVTWGNGIGNGGQRLVKPSYFGIWIAPQPWGPWRQIHEDTAWNPGGDKAARCYAPQIAPKWISRDGQSFWLIWTDFQHVGGPGSSDQFLTEVSKTTQGMPPDKRASIFREAMRQHMPYYSFNTQRVDLIV